MLTKFRPSLMLVVFALLVLVSWGAILPVAQWETAHGVWPPPEPWDPPEIAHGVWPPPEPWDPPEIAHGVWPPPEPWDPPEAV